MALRTKDDLNKREYIFNLRSLNALRDQGKVGGRPPSTPPLYVDIIMDTIGEGTDVTTGIDGEYSYLVKRMITVCGVLLYFQVSPYYVQFLIYYSVFFGKKNNRKLNK